MKANANRIILSADRALGGWLVWQTLLDGPGQSRTQEFVVVGDPDPRRCEQSVREAVGTGVEPEDIVKAVRRLSENEL